jgi:hypothetical protein
MTSTKRPRRWHGVIAVLIIITACSGDNGPDDDPGTLVKLSYCVDYPFWVAVQDGDGPWTRVLPVAEGKYEANFKSVRGGVATVGAGGGLQVNYGTLAELGTIRCDYGYKFITGTVSGVTYPDEASVSLGGVQGSAVRDTFRLSYVADGPQDLFATSRSYEASGSRLNSIIMRRSLDAPGNTSIAPLVFDSPEAFEPTLASFSVVNQGSALTASADAYWYGSGAAWGYLMSAYLDGATSGQYAAVPVGKLAAGDLSALSAFALDGSSGRYALEYFRTPPDLTIELGPALGAPTVTFPVTGSALRPRVELASQAEYGRMVFANFYQTYYASAAVAMTSAYMGGTPGTWVLQVPDLSSAEGWDPSWGLVPSLSTDWSVTAEGGVDRFLGDVAHDGDSFHSADYRGSETAPVRSPSASGRPEPHRGGFPKSVEP